MNGVKVFLTFVGFAFAAALESQPAAKPSAALSPERAAQARRTIVAWLECEECTEGQLKSVVRLGDLAVPTLSATLAEGPSPASRESLKRHLVATYGQLVEYGKSHPEAKLEMSEGDYIKTYAENYVALYRVRSATALGAIGGSAARKALEKALEKPDREDVKLTVKEALEKLVAKKPAQPSKLPSKA